jgi:drug/metabolite transporter (DMT)-like permease
MHLFLKTLSDNSKGIILALLGVMILTPDTLFMRLSELERWQMAGWRGVLMGSMLFAIWITFMKPNVKEQLLSLISIPGVLVMFAMAFNSINFTLGVAETSIMVVLTALATMPLFAAVLSVFLLKERQPLLGWAILLLAMVGIGLVVNDGGNASNIPSGSTLLGGFYGLCTAFGLAFTFTLARKYPGLGVIPATVFASLISGTVAFYVSPEVGIDFSAPVSVIMMGLIISPFSFALLLVAPKYTQASMVSLIMLLELVLGPIWVWIGIGEKPTPIMILGASLVLFSIIAYVKISQNR